MTIGIVNLNIGNISSVSRMLEINGSKSILLYTEDDFKKVSKIIIPGVGSFDEGVKTMINTGLDQLIVNAVNKYEMPVLGICLGMQLLCRGSEEGVLPGLGLIDADVKKYQFPAESKLKVPHMGWNVVSPTKSNPLLPINEDKQRFYFVHSYKVVPDDADVTIGSASYGGDFCAAFQKGTIFGVQFHPEKSHKFGMALLQRFIEL